MKYGANDNQIHGILFDGAWLWEEYLNTFMKDLGFIHPRKGKNSFGKYMFRDPLKVFMRPDFYIENYIVFDAKYKRHESLFDEKQREDRFQLLAYMHVFNVKKSGLIVPVPAKGERFTKGEIAGRDGEMYLIGMTVDKKTETFKNYCNHMASEEKSLAEQIKILLEL